MDVDSALLLANFLVFFVAKYHRKYWAHMTRMCPWYYLSCAHDASHMLSMVQLVSASQITLRSA